MKFNEKGEIMPDRVEKLKLIKITDPSQKGKVVRVIGIFEDENNVLWINTASNDNKLVNMKLPDGLIEWGEHALYMVNMGVIPFPCDIEFGIFDGHAYAEIL